jgi:hypothetical protein
MDILRKEVVLKQIALYMVFLILTIPIISSNALALSITKVTVVGGDGIEDVMKSSNDYFTATVSTSDDVDPDDIYIQYTKSEAFDECTGSTCTYTSAQNDRSGQEMEYTIQLINDSTVVDEVEGTILIDEEEPEIEDFDIEKEGDVITIRYEVEDTACDDCEGCAGIDYIYLYDNGDVIDEINIASQCEVEDEFETSVTDLNLEDGEHELCLLAVDNVGYESDEACTLLDVDSEGPHFETGSLDIIDAGSGLTVEYIGGDYFLVDLMINVTDAALSEHTVRADLSGLNNVIGDTYSNVSANFCDESKEDGDDMLWTCVWESYYIEDVTGSVQLDFIAYDNEGNEGTYSPTYTLTHDDDAPTIYQIYNEQGLVDDDIYLLSGANSLYVDLDPTGSAFAYGQTYLTFTTASMSHEEADDCWDKGSYWTCVWNFTVSSGTGSASIEIDATDDAGNKMETYDVRVVIDGSEPEITGYSTDLNCPTSADTLNVVVNATDDISEDLFIYFYGGDIRTDDEPIVEECEAYEEESFTCMITVDDFVSYSADEDVLVEIVDLAGNIAEYEIDIEVCELEEAGEPDFVTVRVEDAGPVDLLTLSYMDIPVYLEVDFDMSSYASIVTKSASCDGATDVYFLDDQGDSAIMVVYLEQQTLPDTTDGMYLDCTMTMTMQYGDKVYSTPEVDEFEIDVDLYGSPLGFVDEGIQAKIDGQILGILDSEDKIKKWVTFNTILGILCNIANILTKLEAAMSIVRGVTTIIAYIANAAYYTELALCAIPPLSVLFCPAAEAAFATYSGMVALETAYNSYHAFITGYIWPPGFASFSFGTITKAGCMMYSGRLCEGFYGLENQLIIKADEAGTKQYYKATYDENDNFFQKDVPTSEFRILYDWDPFKSIHTARNCLYPDAIIYNLRKDQQINCMYTTCIENAATNGLDTYACEVQYDQRQCLYVDGAAWRAAGWGKFMQWLQLVLNTALSNADVIVAGIVYWLTPPCGYPGWEGELKTKVLIAAIAFGHEFYPSIYPGMGMSTGCQIVASGLNIMETEWVFSGKAWDFKQELEGTDYCVEYRGATTAEEEE